MMNEFDPLPHAPMPMPKQQLERPGMVRSALMRFFSMFVRDPIGLRREH
ncbi:hypothetical protein NO932_18695 [Pelagibacterium sp. 26DY04]|nr:hypothetical protein [Pelagibacterium sp. 26DY04]WMT86896.1 hypothetical protein NO932_18695 [Pelagibacterium sp. 26DY04]